MRRLLQLVALIVGVCAFAPDARAQVSMHGSPAAFSSRRPPGPLANDSAALGSASAQSPRAATVLTFTLLGAAAGTLLALNACSEAGCMTVLPVAYGIVLGAAAGALIGWIISAAY